LAARLARSHHSSGFALSAGSRRFICLPEPGKIPAASAGCGYIDLLWVRDDQRSCGLGTRLLAAAEAEIRRRGCDRVALSTHSFQAPGFYARFGYTECGRTPGYPHGHDDIHLVKQLH